MTIGSQISSIMNLIELVQLELSPFELEKLLHLTIYTLASSDIKQSAPNFFKIYDYEISNDLDYRPNPRRTTGVICSQIGGIAIFDLAYTPAPKNVI